MSSSLLLRSAPPLMFRVAAHQQRLSCVAPRHVADLAGVSRRQLASSTHVCAATPTETVAPAAPAAVTDTPAPPAAEPLAEGKMVFKGKDSMANWWLGARLGLFALPWRRVASGSVLTIKLSGDISEQSQGWPSKGTSVPQLCSALRNAAHDPRISGICIEVAPLGAGWAKVQEIRRHLEYFRQSGKFSVAFMKTGGEKEYYLASACEEIYTPSTGGLSLRGFAVSGTFLRGVLDKVGIDPQVQRIGKFKSAGDQILRTDMSDAQRQQLDELLQDIYQDFTSTVAAARGKTQEEVSAMLDEGIFEMQQFVDRGYITALKYEDEVLEGLQARTGGKPDEVRKVSLQRYSRVPASAMGFKGKKIVAVLRSAGAITGSGTSSQITPDGLIPTLRRLGKDKKVAAVVLRVDSPGGDALASDLMWREIQQLAKKKPVIASMGDVAASGGYYLSMAASKIVAENLTITGSVGVVAGKFNLAELFEKVGYSKELISRGKYAELLADCRPFKAEELDLFERSARHAYESFRNRAAASRGMTNEAMEEVAQGRVWSGVRAVTNGLVDALGGVTRAVAIAKQAADIPQDEEVTIIELGRAAASPLALLRGGASVSVVQQIAAAAASGDSLAAAVAPLLLLLTGGSAAGPAAAAAMLQPGRASCLMVDVDAASFGSSTAAGLGCVSASGLGAQLLGGAEGSSSGSGLFLGEQDDVEGGQDGLSGAVVEWLEQAMAESL